MIIKDLGAVSAYAYAVEKGYTGTEAEFAELMASYATVAEEAAESAESASQSATSASASAQTATSKASEATTAAQTATAKAEEAQADADAAALDASQALSAASTATTKASEAAQSASDAVMAKTAAQTAQTAAEGSATTAQTAAQTATTKAAEAAESARTLTIDPTLTQSGQAADAFETGNKITSLKEDLTDVESYFNHVFEKVDFRTMGNVVELLGYNMGLSSSTELQANPLSGYNTYYLYPNEDFDLYFDSDDINGITFVNLATVENAGAVQQYGNTYKILGTNAKQYRKSNNNLPTAENPLHLTVGMAFCITETSSTGTFYIRKSSENVELDSSVELSETQVQQVKNSISSKKCALKYISGAGVEASTERVEIYIPTVDGFVRYDFLHSVSTSGPSGPRNTDVWHVGYAYHTTENKTEDYALTTQGAWECATKLTGDGQNFAGGYAHGNEVSTDIIFMIDGAIVNITQITSLREFEELVIFQNSNLYNPLDETTVFAVHGTEHVFDSEGLTIKQSVKFSIATSIATMYMAMFPIAKAISDTVIPNNSFVPLSTSNAIYLYDTDEVSIYKSTGKNKAVFSVPVWEYLTNGYTFLCVDNGGAEYNKCYFVNTLSSVSVAQNKLMKSVAKYNFIVGN